MTDKPKVTAMDLLGIASGGPYDDIPSEYLVGLARGALGDYLQEVHDAGWFVHISPAIGGNRANVKIWRAYDHYYGRDDDTHRVDIMIVRAYIAWKGREV